MDVSDLAYKIGLLERVIMEIQTDGNRLKQEIAGLKREIECLKKPSKK